MKFHHIGIACENIEKELECLQEIFGNLKFSEKVFDPLQNVELCMIDLNGINVELISGEPIKSFLKRNIKFYHICYEVNEFETAVNLLQSKGAILISGIKETTLFENKQVAFFLLNNGMIVELIGDKNG